MKFETTYDKDNPSLQKQLGVYMQYHPIVMEASGKYVIPWPIIAGIGSRESHWGLALKPKGPGGTGDHEKRKGKLPPDGLGWGRGLMQIDYASHEFAQGDKWTDPQENILYGAKVLAGSRVFINRMILKGIIPDMNDYEILRASLAGYNAGPGMALEAIVKEKDIDYYTTGRDYSADVLNRAGWFQQALLVSA